MIFSDNGELLLYEKKERKKKHTNGPKAHPCVIYFLINLYLPHISEGVIKVEQGRFEGKNGRWYKLCVYIKIYKNDK